jgi:hypothetical protein
MRDYLKILTTFSYCFIKHSSSLGSQSAQFFSCQDIAWRVNDPLQTILVIGREEGHLPPTNSQRYTFRYNLRICL